MLQSVAQCLGCTMLGASLHRGRRKEILAGSMCWAEASGLRVLSFAKWFLFFVYSAVTKVIPAKMFVPRVLICAWDNRA